VRSIVDDGVADGSFKVADSEIATFALVQMLTAVTRWYRPQGRLTLDDLVEIYTDLSFGMLHADRAASTHRIASKPAASKASRSISPATSAVSRRPRRSEPIPEDDALVAES
jgi:tetracycline repressor-like protein